MVGVWRQELFEWRNSHRADRFITGATAIHRDTYHRIHAARVAERQAARVFVAQGRTHAGVRAPDPGAGAGNRGVYRCGPGAHLVDRWQVIVLSRTETDDGCDGGRAARVGGDKARFAVRLPLGWFGRLRCVRRLSRREAVRDDAASEKGEREARTVR